MLIQFKVTNHRSILDEQTLSLVAASQDPDDPRLLKPDALEESLLPTVALYGANASGKSNVLNAMAFAAHAVSDSYVMWRADRGVPREPFALGGGRTRPSSFVTEMIVDGVRTEYGFSVVGEHVVDEWLYIFPHGRQQTLFERDRQKFDFGRHLSGDNKTIEGLTRPNSLFLSTAAQNNHQPLAPTFRWFARGVRTVRLGGSLAWPRYAKWLAAFPDGAPGGRALALLEAADLGIMDFRVQHDGLHFQHRGKPGRADVWLALEQESTGTVALVQLIPDLLEVLDVGGVLIVDELNSLHPLLAFQIIRLFQDRETNPKGAQLIFTTHDATLLGNLVGEPPLRRDQIWFTEKDQTGASLLSPLSDFRPRAAENLERGYLQGRYGAVPFFGTFKSKATDD